MANVRISELPAATIPLTGAELVPVVQSGVTKQTTAAAVGANAVNVKAYGAKGDGVTDDTAAIQAAINASYVNYNKTIFVPNGVYRVTGRLTITQGVMIVCGGSQGSNEDYGTVFRHESNLSCFRWDGSGAAFAGTGGGLQNCLIVKANGFSGGNAIEVVNQSDTNRCGEMVFHNVLAYGLGTGRWTRGFVFDGTLTNTPGARGVRTVYMTKCRAADVTTANETVVLNQVAHFYAHGLAVDTGSGAAAGITLRGINDGVYLNALGAAGTFTVVANDASNSTNNLIVDGKVGGAFTCNDTQCNGVVSLANAASGIAIRSKALRLVADNGPEFLAVRTTSVSNATGDGTAYQVAFDTEVFDSLNNFSSNVFNCTVAGKYQFSAGVLYQTLSAGHTRSDITITKTGAPIRSIADVTNPVAQASSGLASRTLSCTLDLAFGDTVYLTAAVTGSTKTVNIFGSSGTDYTWFSGKYIP